MVTHAIASLVMWTLGAIASCGCSSSCTSGAKTAGSKASDKTATGKGGCSGTNASDTVRAQIAKEAACPRHLSSMRVVDDDETIRIELTAPGVASEDLDL